MYIFDLALTPVFTAQHYDKTYIVKTDTELRSFVQIQSNTEQPQGKSYWQTTEQISLTDLFPFLNFNSYWVILSNENQPNLPF